jgi:hypothetical protein
LLHLISRFIALFCAVHTRFALFFTILSLFHFTFNFLYFFILINNDLTRRRRLEFSFYIAIIKMFIFVEDIDFSKYSLSNNLLTFLVNFTMAILFHIDMKIETALDLMILPLVVFFFLYGFMTEYIQRYYIFNEDDKKSIIEIGPNKSILLYSIKNKLFKSRNHLQEILV